MFAIAVCSTFVTRFLHSADWQLGMTRHFLSGEAQARFSAARIEAIGTIGAVAIEKGCSFVVVCGDVFETNQVERQVIVRALDAMKATPRVDFYLLPGNHDPLDAGSIYKSKTFLDHCPSNVKVLMNSDPVPVEPSLEIIGVPWVNKKPTSDLVARAISELVPDSTLRVVVGHGAIDSLVHLSKNPSDIGLLGLETSIAEGKIHYVALGDRHSTTCLGTTGRVWYSGTSEVTDYDELDPGNVLLVDLDADSIEVETIHVGTWRFVREHFELAREADCESVERYLGELVDKSRTVVKLSLVGQLSLSDMARLDLVLENASDLLGGLETWERRSDLVALPDSGDLERLGLVGFAAEALEDLRVQGEGNGEQALMARDALGLLYRLAGPGKRS